MQGIGKHTHKISKFKSSEMRFPAFWGGMTEIQANIFCAILNHTFPLAASFVSVSIQSAESRLLIKALRIRVVTSCTWNKKKDFLTTSDANSSKRQSNYTWSVKEIKETMQKQR